MARWVWFLLWFVCSSAFPAFAAQVYPDVSAQQMADLAEVEPVVLVENERTISIIVDEETQRKPARIASGFVLVRAPVTQVAEVITDYSQYPRFMPANVAAEVLQEGSERLVELTLEIDLKIISVNPSYILAVTSPGEYQWNFRVHEGDGTGSIGSWQLYDLGSKGTLVRYSMWTNFAETSFLVRTIVSAQPDMVKIFPSTSAILTLQALRDYVEQRAAQTPTYVQKPRTPLMHKHKARKALTALVEHGTVMAVSPRVYLHTKGEKVNFPFVTAIAKVPRPQKLVESSLLGFTKYPEWFPQLKHAKVRKSSKATFVEWTLGVDLGPLSLPLQYTSAYMQVGPGAWIAQVLRGELGFNYSGIEWWPATNPQETVLVFTNGGAPNKDSASMLKLMATTPNSDLLTSSASSLVIVENQANNIR